MAEWKVEIAQRFGLQLLKWNRSDQLEFQTILARLQKRGPEGLGLLSSELEGFPPWEDLGQPYEREVVLGMKSGIYRLVLDILPNREIFILSASRIAVH